MSIEWRPVHGWEGLYEVSSTGQVRSLDRTTTTRAGVPKTYRGRVLTPGRNSCGRLTVLLNRPGETKSKSVHRLVAEAFCPGDGPVVRHLDDDPSNNNAWNLAWGSYSDNQRDRVRNGIYRNGMTEWTHCRAGHEYTEENIYRWAKKPNQRNCRACIRRRSRDNRSKKKEETA